MDQKENVSPTENVPPTDEPFLGTFDIFLLFVLFAGAIWYLLRRKNQKEVQPERTYSIQ